MIKFDLTGQLISTGCRFTIAYDMEIDEAMHVRAAAIRSGAWAELDIVKSAH